MTTTKSESIGERMKEARLKKGLRQKDLANILNVAEITVKKYENRAKNLHIDTVKKIANALEISPNWLMFGLTDEQKNKKDSLNSTLNTLKFLESLGYTLEYSGGEECDLIINGAKYTPNDIDILIDMIKACIDNCNKLKRGDINGKNDI